MKTRSFVQMLGLGAARAEDDEPNKDDDEQASAAEDDEPNKDHDEQASAAEGDDPDKEDGAEDDDPDKEDAKAARRAERARCATIFAAGVRAGLPELAGTLAADTDMTAEAAIATLKSAKAVAGRRGSLAATMATVEVPNLGADASSASGGEKSVEALVRRATGIYDGLTKGAAKAK